jgi:hypothetical protein
VVFITIVDVPAIPNEMVFQSENHGSAFHTG